MAKARKKRASGKKAKQAPPKASTSKAKAKPRKKKPLAAGPKPQARGPAREAIPQPIVETSTSGKRRATTAREWATRSSPVVEILDDAYPIGALRRFLDSIKGYATQQQAQIALGAAQLMLLPSAVPARGAAEVKEIVDMVLERWADFGDRRNGFHAQEFLRNAFGVIGVDRERIARLVALVPPHTTTELLYNLAAAHAVARDKVAMLVAVERALDAGATTGQFRRGSDFVPYASDPDLSALLARAEVPPIPVDVDPHRVRVRTALDALVATLRELGMKVELRPPVRLDAILDAERAAKISLPNDYRALLTITNGMRAWDHEFFGAGDFREPTKLATRARSYLAAAANFGTAGIEGCVPLAAWQGHNDWLLYDPRGEVRGGDPGYVLKLDAQELPVADLVSALARIEATARDVLGTN
jgi:hypothetical protein